MPGEPLSLSFDDVELVTERELGTLGHVFIVGRKDGAQPEDPDPWLGLAKLALRPLVPEGNESEEAVSRLRADAGALAAAQRRDLQMLPRRLDNVVDPTRPGIAAAEHLREHPNLLKVVGVGRRRDAELVALECPEGIDLATLIATRQFSLARAVVVAREIASALSCLAPQGRFHADLTSSCVFVPKLSGVPPAGEADLGLGGAKLLPLALPADYRVEHRACPQAFYRGSPAYAAPELHSDAGREPTEKSNIFAFGVLFYETLAGRPPFSGGTPTRMLLDIREREPGPFAKGLTTGAQAKGPAAGIPEDLERICMRCLEKDPERRFPNFAAVESSLRIAEETVGLSTSSSSTRELAVPSGGSHRDHQSARREPQGRSARRTTSQPINGVDSLTRSLPLWRRRLSGRPQILIAASVAALVVLSGALLLVLLSRKRGREETLLTPEGSSATMTGYKILVRAEELIAQGRPEEAKLLLESHPRVREVDADAYDGAKRRARVRLVRTEAKRAEARGDWQAALDAYEELLHLTHKKSLGPSVDNAFVGKETFRAQRAVAAYKVSLAKAGALVRADEWERAVKLLEEAEAAAVKLLDEAEGLAGKLQVEGSDLERIRHDLKLARLITQADAAGKRAISTADARRWTQIRQTQGSAVDRRASASIGGSMVAKQRELLFQALRLVLGNVKPEDVTPEDVTPEYAAVQRRLAKISAGPDASAEALEEARKALETGDLKAAAAWAHLAGERWPDSEEPGAVLAYVAVRRFCEEAGMVLVSPHVLGGGAWGAVLKWDGERGASFCIDRYEYPGRAGQMPLRGVSAVEAAARCRERGGRLCTLREWRLACGGPGALAYPYGNRYVREKSNTGGGRLLPCGSFPAGVSPFGVHDMSGNVAEWTAEVEGGARLVVSHVMGGDWGGGAAHARCDTALRFNPGLTSPRVGFRCCRSIPKPEDGTDTTEARRHGERHQPPIHADGRR